MSEPNLADNRSMLKDFIASISVIRGDLSNITAPPFVLDTKSAVELPAFWAERPSVFVAAASSNDPAERAFLVLRWFLSSLRNQQYAGRSEAAGVKKPLNAFLGEVFLARWDDEAGTTRLVSEQVSHHPPVTACRVWNEEHGVSAEGYTRQEITFSGSVNIKQIGHATLLLARYNETYLIPLPNVKIKSILTGNPYPELEGTYYIPSTSGYTSCIDFSAKGLFSSSDKKHSFEATVYRHGEEANPLYAISGHWDGQFTSHDYKREIDIETFDVTTARTTPIATESLSEQDPWESRRAWSGVREALERGNMQGAADAKAKIENGQREMHKNDPDGKNWKRLFYEADSRPDEVAEALGKQIGLTFDAADTVGAWRFNRREWENGNFKKPFYEGLLPDNTHGGRPMPANSARVENARTSYGIAAGATAVAGTAARDSAPGVPVQTNIAPAGSFYQQATVGASEQDTARADAPFTRIDNGPPSNMEHPPPSNINYAASTRVDSGPPSNMETPPSPNISYAPATRFGKTPPSYKDYTRPNSDRAPSVRNGNTPPAKIDHADATFERVAATFDHAPAKDDHARTITDHGSTNTGHAPTNIDHAKHETTIPSPRAEYRSPFADKSERESPVELAQPRREADIGPQQRDGTFTDSPEMGQVKNMSTAQVENFLRDQYSSPSRKKGSRKSH
ncbi:hypothetical protein H2200_008785 [Cladophialophora chaetospira]|uniref:Oxysterol-binding protein n=1 Tax=Cladophialophora chaetospira TaxID=386627 RepID=A0AA39CFV9_9EURO|nr:hypothetical protein H2200_008785 [Cladophialophora chaetospira]